MKRNTMGYIKEGHGISRRAESAYSDGRCPATKICSLLDDYPVILRFYKSKKAAKEAILSKGTSEWHHTGSYGQRTLFYDVATFAEDLELYGGDPLVKQDAIFQRVSNILTDKQSNLDSELHTMVSTGNENIRRETSNMLSGIDYCYQKLLDLTMVPQEQKDPLFTQINVMLDKINKFRSENSHYTPPDPRIQWV